MKFFIRKNKNCKRTLEVALPAEKVRDEFDRVYKSIGKTASVPGYRIGKAPRDLLELYYGKTAEEEVLKNLIPEAYKKVLEEHKLEPIGYPHISDVRLDFKEGLSYRASIETRPEFSLRNYKGLRLKRKDMEIKEEDVEKNLEAIREANAQRVPKQDSEEKEKVLPGLDDEFAKDLGFETLEKLKDAVRGNLKEKLKQESESDLEMQVINQLIEGINFELPESLVNTEKERLLKDANNRIAYIDAVQKKQNPDKSFSLTDKDRKELEENAQKQAVQQVKAFFILDRIAQIEKIYLKEEDIERRVEQIAAQYKKTKDEVRRHLEKSHMLDEIAVNMRNAKVMEFLLKEAKVAPSKEVKQRSAHERGYACLL